MGSYMLGSAIWYQALTYFSLAFQDTKILVGEWRGLSSAHNTEVAVYWQSIYVASISRNLFPKIANLEWHIFQDEEQDFFDAHTLRINNY